MRAETWEVTVSVNGENVLTLGSSHMSGVENINEYAERIRECAQHLLSFIGDDPADALACLSSPQEPVAWDVTDAMVERACLGYWPAHWEQHMDEKDKASIRVHMRKAIEAAFASPVVPVAEKAEAEGWRPPVNAHVADQAMWRLYAHAEAGKTMVEAMQATLEEFVDRKPWAAPTCEGERP